MKTLLSIALMTVIASGCALSSRLKTDVSTPTIGMSEDDFKQANRRADLVYLSADTSSYQIYRAGGENMTWSDFYYFINKKLSKFERKTHYYNNNNVNITQSKDKKN